MKLFFKKKLQVFFQNYKKKKMEKPSQISILNFDITDDNLSSLCSDELLQNETKLDDPQDVYRKFEEILSSKQDNVEISNYQFLEGQTVLSNILKKNGAPSPTPEDLYRQLEDVTKCETSVTRKLIPGITKRKREDAQLGEEGTPSPKKNKLPEIDFDKDNSKSIENTFVLAKSKPVSTGIYLQSKFVFSLDECLNVTSCDEAHVYRLLELLVDAIVDTGAHSHQNVTKNIFWFIAWSSAFNVSRQDGTYATYTKKKRSRGIPQIFTRKKQDARIAWDLSSKGSFFKFCKNNFSDGRNFSSTSKKNQRGGFVKQFERTQRYWYMPLRCIEDILYDRSHILEKCTIAFQAMDLKEELTFEEFAHKMAGNYIKVVATKTNQPWLFEDAMKLECGANYLRGVASYEDFDGPTTTVASYVMSYLTEICQKKGVDVIALKNIADNAGLSSNTFNAGMYCRLHQATYDEDVPPPSPVTKISLLPSNKKCINQVVETRLKKEYGGNNGLLKSIVDDAKFTVGKLHDCATIDVFIKANRKEIDKTFFKSTKGEFTCKTCCAVINTLAVYHHCGGPKDQLRHPFTRTFFSKSCLRHLKNCK